MVPDCKVYKSKLEFLQSKNRQQKKDSSNKTKKLTGDKF